MKVKDIMTSHICCVAPDMTIENAAKLMHGADVGVIPVCDSDGVCGIITDRDIVVRGLSKGMDNTTKIRDIMTHTVVSISPDATIGEASEKMAKMQVRRLPVVSGRDLVGMLSLGDIARSGRFDTEVASAEQGIAEDTALL